MNPYSVTGQMVEYIYDGMGSRVAKGNISSFSCDQTTNGFVATNNYIYGPSAEQWAEYGVWKARVI